MRKVTAFPTSWRQGPRSCCHPLYAAHSKSFHYRSHDNSDRLKIDTNSLSKCGELMHIIVKPDYCWSAELCLCNTTRIELLLQLKYGTGVFIVTVVIRHQWNNHCLYKHVYRYVWTLGVCIIPRNSGKWIISHRNILADGTAKTKWKLYSIAESKYRFTYWQLWKRML